MIHHVMNIHNSPSCAADSEDHVPSISFEVARRCKAFTYSVSSSNADISFWSAAEADAYIDRTLTTCFYSLFVFSLVPFKLASARHPT